MSVDMDKGRIWIIYTGGGEWYRGEGYRTARDIANAHRFTLKEATAIAMVDEDAKVLTAPEVFETVACIEEPRQPIDFTKPIRLRGSVEQVFCLLHKQSKSKDHPYMIFDSHLNWICSVNRYGDAAHSVYSIENIPEHELENYK